MVINICHRQDTIPISYHEIRPVLLQDGSTCWNNTTYIGTVTQSEYNKYRQESANILICRTHQHYHRQWVPNTTNGQIPSMRSAWASDRWLWGRKTLTIGGSLTERDYVTFGSLLSQFRLSSVTLVHPTQEGVEAFSNISSPLCT